MICRKINLKKTASILRRLAFFISINLSSQTVYKTHSWSKDHLSGCRMIKNVSAALSTDKALREGLSAWMICQPSTEQGIRVYSTAKKTSGVNSSNRCFGPTKAGSRCKRSTRTGNNFCSSTFYEPGQNFSIPDIFIHILWHNFLKVSSVMKYCLHYHEGILFEIIIVNQ